MNTTRRKETELFHIELNTIVSNKPDRNIFKKKTNKKQKAEHVCPCQLRKKKKKWTDSNKAIADRRPNLFWTWAFTYLLSYDV